MFWMVVLEKTLDSPLNCKEIQPVHPKGSQLWIFIGRTDVEADPPILRPPDAKNWPTGKDTDAGKDWRQEEKGTTEDEMIGWHYWLKGHVWLNSRSWWWIGRPGACSLWGHKESDMTEQLNWTELNWMIGLITTSQEGTCQEAPPRTAATIAPVHLCCCKWNYFVISMAK